ncbi:MATE family efflux transporter [Citreimonas salinaria]|uniref:Putative efflux protein, MATE family n=1 Tax=Citreimonas salinaria TaxID=321339 RepID=A0A1H3J4A0_9RHOB|nr:MATE family efflux transporter [Citreimonas salinaria]SDY34415.1 putative efflux protein, MATE family [Citreimonas salinaria]
MTAAHDDLNQGPVWRKLTKVSAPMALGILGVLLVGLADAFFLARVGETELTAVGFVYPVIVAVSAFSVGMSAGANAAFSQTLGHGDGDAAEARLTLHAVGFGLVVGVAIGAVLWLGAPAIFTTLGAGDAVLEAILNYVPWWAASFPILVATMILNASFRAAGDGATPSGIMVMTAVLNIALTPVFVFGVGPIGAMGMMGAGVSTLLARSLALAVAVVLARRQGRLSPGPRPLEGMAASLRAITATGLPAGASRAVNPAGMAAVTMAVATIGDTAVAGFGAASRVQAIALVPFFAVASGLAPVIGQAWGAGRAERAAAAMRVAVWFALGYGLSVALILWIFADAIAGLMTAGQDAAAYTAHYLRIVGWSLGAYGVVLAANAAMTARSSARWALGLSLLRIGALYVPLAWLGVTLFGYAGVLAATVIANALAAWAGLILARHKRVLRTDTAPIAGPANRLWALGDHHGE